MSEQHSIPPDTVELRALVDWMRDRYITAMSQLRANMGMGANPLSDPEAWRIQADRLERLLDAVGIER